MVIRNTDQYVDALRLWHKLLDLPKRTETQERMFESVSAALKLWDSRHDRSQINMGKR